MISKKMLLDNTGKDISAKLKKMNYNLITYLKNDNNKSISELISGNIQEFEDENIINIKQFLLAKCFEFTKVNLPKCTNVGDYAFYCCTALLNVNLPECVDVGDSAFLYCEKLQNVNIPKCTIINQAAFSNCTALESIDLPKCTTVGDFAFNDCEKLSNVNLPECEGVGTRSFLRCTALSKIIFQKIERMAAEAFEDCSNLETLIIKNDTRVCSMYRQGTTDALSGTKIESGNGYIYVPDKLVQQYKREYNWVKYANQIKPLSEYTE